VEVVEGKLLILPPILDQRRNVLLVQRNSFVAWEVSTARCKPWKAILLRHCRARGNRKTRRGAFFLRKITRLDVPAISECRVWRFWSCLLASKNALSLDSMFRCVRWMTGREVVNVVKLEGR
jgi:hypothetical protein